MRKISKLEQLAGMRIPSEFGAELKIQKEFPADIPQPDFYWQRIYYQLVVGATRIRYEWALASIEFTHVKQAQTGIDRKGNLVSTPKEHDPHHFYPKSIHADRIEGHIKRVLQKTKDIVGCYPQSLVVIGSIDGLFLPSFDSRQAITTWVEPPYAQKVPTGHP